MAHPPKPPKPPEPCLTILDEKDVAEIFQRLDATYLFVMDMLMVYRRVPVRPSVDGTESKVVPFRTQRHEQPGHTT